MDSILTYPSGNASGTLTYLTDKRGNNPFVEKSSRVLLAENLKALADEVGMRINGWAVSRRLNERKAARAANNDTDTRLDTLDEIAKAAHRKPWELISPPGEIAIAQPSDGGDLDYLLTRIPSRKDRILAYALAAQVIDAIASGLVVQPIRMLDPRQETPREARHASGQVHTHSGSKPPTDPA